MSACCVVGCQFIAHTKCADLYIVRPKLLIALDLIPTWTGRALHAYISKLILEHL